MKHLQLFEDFINDDISQKITDMIITFIEDVKQDENLTSIEEVVEKGYCADIASIIYEKFRNEVYVLGDSDFVSDKKDLIYGIFSLDDNGLPLTLKYGSKPHVNWNEIKSLPVHAWIYHNGKHYDMENPNGVSNLFDMEYFKKRML